MHCFRVGEKSIRKVLSESLGYTDVSDDDVRIIYFVGRVIAIRAAVLTSTREFFNYSSLNTHFVFFVVQVKTLHVHLHHQSQILMFPMHISQNHLLIPTSKYLLSSICSSRADRKTKMRNCHRWFSVQ